MTKWTNYGDVNPMEHGGTWIKPDTEMEHGSYYYLEKWTPLDDREGYGVCQSLYIDLEDHRDADSIKAIQSYIGLDYMDDIDFLIGLVGYWGVVNLGGAEFVFDVETMIGSLREQGIEVEE